MFNEAQLFAHFFCLDPSGISYLCSKWEQYTELTSWHLSYCFWWLRMSCNSTIPEWWTSRAIWKKAFPQCMCHCASCLWFPQSYHVLPCLTIHWHDDAAFSKNDTNLLNLTQEQLRCSPHWIDLWNHHVHPAFVRIILFKSSSCKDPIHIHEYTCIQDASRRQPPTPLSDTKLAPWLWGDDSRRICKCDRPMEYLYFLWLSDHFLFEIPTFCHFPSEICHFLIEISTFSSVFYWILYCWSLF